MSPVYNIGEHLRPLTAALEPATRTMRRLRNDDIQCHRDQVIVEARSFFGPMYKMFGDAIDALLSIQYGFKLPNVAATTPEQRVQSLVQKWLYMSIYKFHASLALAEQGFYTESITLNRSLMEHLVTIYYLADHPTDIDRLQMVSQRVAKQLTMRDRFEYVIPGYYAVHYKLSSEFTHPSHGSHIFKIRPDGAGGYNPEMGISFDAETMSFCWNEMTVLLSGFLKAYSTKFKSVLHYRDIADIDQIQDALKALLSVIFSHIDLKGGENAWHMATRPLWDW